jgi:hypothetical protein
MSKRTTTSHFLVERLERDGQWHEHSFENSERMARRAVRNVVQHHNTAARARGNPHNPNVTDFAIIFEETTDVIPR